jgi:hypothetical protein
MPVLVCVALLAALAWALPAGAQGFGKNKVHYERLEWAVLETPHLRLHYHAEEESLARALVVFAESTCVEFDARFRMTLPRPIPVLLYATHHLFQQTNATPSLIGEGTGGLTELIKGRVLFPHNGSWSRLRWVTRHELVHAYMLEKITQVHRAQRKAVSWLPPLWFIEGLAEYASTEWDAEAEGLMRDMVCTRLATPLTRSESITGTVAMYKHGQSFLLWFAERHGERAVFDLLENLPRADAFETVFPLTVGRTLAELDEEWFEAQRARYWPEVAHRTRPRDVARRMPEASPFNLGPRALPVPARPDTAAADTLVRYCWFSVDDGAVDLLVRERDRRGRPRTRRLLRGGASPAFESFHLFQNRPGVGASGRIAVTAKRGGRDALYVLDAASGRVERRLEFPMLVAMHGPVFVPGDSAVVFSAQDYSGRGDLYRASWPGGVARLERLTRDDFDDLDPSVSPDGRWVAFASDRADLAGRYGLFRLSLADGRVERLSRPATGDDRQPVYSPDGAWLLFRSTRGGSSDLYVRGAEPAAEVRRVTRMLGPVSDPDWTPDGRAVLFTAQEAVTVRTHVLPLDPDSLPATLEQEPEVRPVLPAVAYEEPGERYRRQLSLDLLQNGFVVDPGVGGGAGSAGAVAFSDVLGNEQWTLVLANDSEQFGDFWDGWQGALTYFNQGQRFNYGVGVFRLTSLYDADFDAIRREKRLGAQAFASYPFDRFTRVEGGVVLRHVTDHFFRDGSLGTIDQVTHSLSLVRDDARWTWDGPVGGTRAFLSAAYTRDLTLGKADFTTLLAEARHYRQPLPGVVSATRLSGQLANGEDVERFYLGGPTRIRVLDRRFIAGTRTVVAQQEVRFPLVRGLVLGFPAPWQLPTIGGAVFADAAVAWDGPRRAEAGVLGFGTWLGGGVFPAIRWNWLWITRDLGRLDDRRPRMLFSIAYNF